MRRIAHALADANPRGPARARLDPLGVLVVAAVLAMLALAVLP